MWIAELTGRSGRAAFRVHVEGVLEALGLPNIAVEPGGTGLRRSVEDCGAHRLRELMGVLGAEFRPVRRAEKRQGFVADGRT